MLSVLEPNFRTMLLGNLFLRNLNQFQVMLLIYSLSKVASASNLVKG
jgi:hypothetical protein